MPECVPVHFGEGGIAILCFRGQKPRKLHDCDICGRPARWQCDYLVSPGKTCDRFLCGKHRTQVEKTQDYCPEHAQVLAPRLEGF